MTRWLLDIIPVGCTMVVISFLPDWSCTYDTLVAGYYPCRPYDGCDIVSP